MDKSVLMDYYDSCRLVEETERDIEKLRRRRSMTQDVVSGSSREFPYEARRIRVEETAGDDLLESEIAVLAERKAAAEEKKIVVERWMLTLSSRLQRIIRYRVFEKLTWEETAAKMGRNATGEGIKKEYQRAFSEE